MKRSEIFVRRYDDELGLETACQTSKAAGILELVGMSQRRVAQKLIEHWPRLIAGRNDTNLPYRFFAPSQRSRNIRFDHFRTRAQVPENSFRFFESMMKQ